jgi:hypothetical protein
MLALIDTPELLGVIELVVSEFFRCASSPWPEDPHDPSIVTKVVVSKCVHRRPNRFLEVVTQTVKANLIRAVGLKLSQEGFSVVHATQPSSIFYSLTHWLSQISLLGCHGVSRFLRHAYSLTPHLSSQIALLECLDLSSSASRFLE